VPLRRLLPVALFIMVLGVAPAARAAAVQVGIGDQKAASFADVGGAGSG
jgi:hypothetical protein